MTELDHMLDAYMELTTKADARVLELDRELANVDKEISAAEKPDTKGGAKQVSILLVGDTDEEVKLFLKYGTAFSRKIVWDWSAQFPFSCTRCRLECELRYPSGHTIYQGERHYYVQGSNHTEHR